MAIKFQEVQPEFVNVGLGKFYGNRQSTVPTAKPILEIPKIDFGIPEDQFKTEIQTLKEKHNATDDEINQAIDGTAQISDKEGAKGFAKNFLQKLIPSKTYEIKPDKPKESETITIKDRGIQAKPKELDILRGILFSEISNRPQEKQELESRVIANTAFNRMKEQSKTLEQVLTQIGAYQGITNEQFKKAMKGQLNDLDKEKMKIVEKIIEEIKSGQFGDNTENSVFYIHNPDGTITYRPGKLGGFSEKYHNLEELLK